MNVAQVQRLPRPDRPIIRAGAGTFVVSTKASNIVRPLQAGDLDEVARLFLTRFRPKGAQADQRARNEVADYMRQVYLEAPSCAEGIDSLVQINAHGRIGAFVGVIRMNFSLDGKPLKAGISGALMSSPSPEDSMAAVQLLRELRRSALDMVFTDTANRSSLALCRAMKYKVVSPESLEWAYVFKPAAAILDKLGRRLPWTPTALLRPFAWAADQLAEQALRPRAPAKVSPGWRDIAIDAASFIDKSPSFLVDARLRPDLSRDEFEWIVAQAQQRQSAGPLHFRAVYDACDKLVGCYAFYGERNRVAQVLQLMSAERSWGGVLAHVVETTRSMGCLSVHGAAQKGMMAYLYSIPGALFYYANGAMLYSNRSDVNNVIDDGAASIGGFAGDRWSRLGTDHFG